MSPHPLTNFEIQVLLNKPKFNVVCSRNNLPKIKDEAYVINLSELKSIGTHWTALHVNVENVTYFDSFRVSIFQKKLESSLEIKVFFLTNIYRKHMIQ